VKARTAKYRHSGAMAQAAPPTCDWGPAGSKRYDGTTFEKLDAPKQKYAAFLSHYKMEASGDARYLEQQLEAMLNTDIFVDSNDLVDLDKLFEEGVLNSEMIVLLGTSGVLTRPWCLLELYEARRNKIPVLTLAMSAHCFTPASARDQLVDLHTKLPEGAEQLIRDHLQQNPNAGEPPDSWERFLELVAEAVDPTGDGVAHPPLYQEWHNMGADQQVKAEIKALVESMGQVTQRRLHWSESGPSAAEPAEPRSWKDVLLCRAGKQPKHVICVFETQGSSAARMLMTGLKEKLGKPVLLSGQWAATYAELNSEHQHLADAVHSGTPDAVKEAQDTMDDVVDKVRERIEDAIAFGVQGSGALVVLLTEHVLCCPLTLLEVYTAMQRDITIVPVVVAGSNYDFAKTPAQLQRLAAHLEEELGEVLYNDVLGLLARRGISMGQMQSKLKKLPNLIAVTMEVQEQSDASEGWLEVVASRCVQK